MDRKKLLNMAIGTLLGILILLVLVAVAFTVLHKSPAATPTPLPTITPQPTATATPAPTATPTPTAASGRVYNNDGPFLMSALLKGDTGQLVIGITVAPGAATVEVKNISMSVVCDGRTFDNVWTLKPMDWDNFDGDTILKPDDNIAARLDTVALGIPQGKPMTIKVTRNGDFFQEISVAPTY